jgi:polyhydroxyalkanoate synthesis regulator protein
MLIVATFFCFCVVLFRKCVKLLDAKTNDDVHPKVLTQILLGSNSG